VEYYFNEDHQLFRQSFREFLQKEVVPHLDAWEEAREVPKDIFRKMGEMGFFGLHLPEKYGGTDADFFFSVIFFEELERINSGGFAAAMGSHAYLALPHIHAVGSEAMKDKYLTGGVSGELVGCLAISEPSGGSDVAGMRSRAESDGDHWVLNGEKIFITNGVNSDFIVVAAKTAPDKGAHGISMFVVDRDTPGVSAIKLKKLGWHASDTGQIAFDNVRIPKENLIGMENAGFLYIMQRFALERLVVAIGAVAMADHALELTLQYMAERSAFGRPINKFQVLRHEVAQMASEIEAQRAYVYHLCRAYGDGHNVVKEAAMSKLLTTELCDKVVYKCLQMHGGYGYMEDYPMARMYRDSRLGPIGGGTSEIMREIIAKITIDGAVY
jgi:acyl-CoA dehydrogenase